MGIRNSILQILLVILLLTACVIYLSSIWTQDSLPQETNMPNPDHFILTITYTNNSKQSYKLPRQGDANTLAKRLDEFRQYNDIIIHTQDNKLILIPFSNILNIEVAPMPDVYAKSVLHGAIPV